jgi:hypothetical protein
MLNYDEIRNKLLSEKCIVHFTKVNGEERVMSCTLNSNLIPQEFHPKSNKESSKGEEPTVMRVFDLESAGWRSFRIESVTQFFS